MIETFELFPLGLFGFQDGLLQNYLAGQRIELAVEGSRHFRPPTGLGEMLYEGCDIAMLADASANRGLKFVEQSTSAVLRVETLAGQKVSLFEEKLEQDTWTTFISFPKPNLAIVCNDRAYLREVLERIGGRVAQRALSDTLPEWRFAGVDAPFWGLRHYDKSQADRDPSSPLTDQNAIGMDDRQASGITFKFDPGNKNVATIFYLSGRKDILDFAEKGPLSMNLAGVVDPAAKLPVTYRLAAPGVAEVNCELGDRLPIEAFLFIAMALFGHAVYL